MSDANGDTISYAPDIPTEADLKLLGRLDGKRVLELGCGTGAAAIAIAKQGARVIAVDESADHIDQARHRADQEEVKVEFHQGDLADLAFVRADTVDVALSLENLATVEDPGRVFRQVHRVLRPEAPLVLSVPHPTFRMLTGGSGGGPPLVSARYFESTTIAGLFTALTRTNFQVDVVLEPEPVESASGVGSWAPTTLILRARKQGI